MIDYNGYLLNPDSKFPQNIRIAKAGKGGSMPIVLTDLYTTREVAKSAIDLYLAKPKRSNTNAKAVKNS